jgi:hypothetical protein
VSLQVTTWVCLLGHVDCKDYHGPADVASQSRLVAYADHAAKVGRLFGIKLAQRRGAKR